MLDTIDHIAIQVENIEHSVTWYTNEFNADIIYQDNTWALLKFNNVNLALVLPEQHPYHFAIRRPDADKYGRLTKHRDDSLSIYIQDNNGNTVEIVKPDKA